MKQILKNIEEILEQLKKNAHGYTLPNGHEVRSNPSHFARYVQLFFAEINKLNEEYPNLWRDNEYMMVYDCERLSRNELAVTTLKSYKNQEETILRFYNQISEIVDIIHKNLWE